MRRVLSSTVIFLSFAAMSSVRGQSPEKAAGPNAPAPTFSLTVPSAAGTAVALHSSVLAVHAERVASPGSATADSRAAHVRHDAIVGGGIGAALGVVGGSLVHVGCDASDSGCSAAGTRASAILTSAVIVGVIGAGVGALVGLLRSGQ